MNGLLATSRANSSFSDRPRRNRPPKPLPRQQSFLLEPLESRLLLSADAGTASTIVWVNRGDDNFDDVFGANAQIARAVVDASIDSWNRVITDFHYGNGSNQFDLTLSMADSGTGTGASAGFPTNIIDGKPQAGTITISRGNDTNGDGDGDGAGFFLDPTPFESSEFMGNIVNAFAGDAQAGSPAAGLTDLYTVALLELTHEMGITSAGGLRYQTGGFLTPTGVSDPAGNGSGFFWVFTGADITALMTSFDSGNGGTDFGPGVHTAEGGPGETFNGLFGSEDSGNAFFEFGRRYLVSNKDALILKDAYDYDIAMPETFGTFYSVLNQSTGEVLIRGGAGTSADNISVTRDSGDIVVSVDLGTDVVGLGPTDAFVTRYHTGEPVSINVQAGDGPDGITIGAGLGFGITIDAGSGNDNVNVSNNAGFPITISGGAGNDTLIANSDVTISGGAGDDLIVGSDGNDILHGLGDNDTIYGLGGNDTITGDDGNDTIYAGTGNNMVSDGTGNDFVDLSENSVAINYTTGGDNDTVIGTAFNDIITGGVGTDRLEGRGGNDLLIGRQGADTLIGGDESDTFTWNPGDGNDVIEGGDGINDVLVFNGSPLVGEIFTLSAVGTRLELLRSVGTIDMDVAGVEQVDLNALGGADSATVNDLTQTDVHVVNINLGTDLDEDDVTVNGRESADNLTAAISAGAMHVTGLNYDVNVISVTPTDTLTVNGNAGNDSIFLTLAGAGDVRYTPTATDGGTFASSLSLVTITSTEVLIYDGQGNTNSLTIVGTVGPDTIVHTPGGNDQAGSLQVNSLLALNYQNLGSGASLTVEGGTGNDELVYNGTNTNDSFTIGVTGQVNLNSRLVLNTTSVEILTLEGLNGDDTFTLVPAISDSVYSTINLNGGSEASVGGDHVNLIGTGLSDDIIANGPAISLGGKTINTSGTESISLDALGGTDRITYNGVVGVTENIAVSGSSTPGSGQISVPGTTLINFTSVEGIVVNGNPPTATETDTLTFAGTTAPDTFNINLAAVGTSGDPVLTLNNNGTLLLTLENYTNFNTLNVKGLDGDDTFNVFTADFGDGRNLFVDGGSPTGKKKATDTLNIFYTGLKPSITHSTATQDPDAGITTLEYDVARFVVQYDDVETVPPPKKQ